MLCLFPSCREKEGHWASSRKRPSSFIWFTQFTQSFILLRFWLTRIRPKEIQVVPWQLWPCLGQQPCPDKRGFRTSVLCNRSGDVLIWLKMTTKINA
jgi:hypothetical protein